MSESGTFNRSSLAEIGSMIGFAFGLLAGPTLAQSPEPTNVPGTNNPEHTITVNGVGTVKVRPDVADVQLGIQITRDTAKAARDDAADAMNKVLAALRELGIDDDDLRTSYVNVGPMYDYSTNSQRLIGYQVSNVIARASRAECPLRCADRLPTAAGPRQSSRSGRCSWSV